MGVTYWDGFTGVSSHVSHESLGLPRQTIYTNRDYHSGKLARCFRLFGTITKMLRQQELGSELDWQVGVGWGGVCVLISFSQGPQKVLRRNVGGEVRR